MKGQNTRIVLKKEHSMAIIVTDSTCDLTLEEVKELGIEMLSLTVNFKEEQFVDKVTLSNEEFYKKLEESDEIPTTALLNPADFLEVFNKYMDEDIIVILISSKLSGTYQSAMIAKDITGRENIHVIDSRAVTAALGLLVRIATAWNKEGKTTADIIEGVQGLIEKVRLVAAIDTLAYLVKGGRLSGAAGIIGTALNLKPIIMLKDGEIINTAKTRGSKAAFKEITKIVAEDKPNTAFPIFYAHTNAAEALEAFRSSMSYEGDAYMIGSVVGTHAGPGAVALSYIAQ